MISMWRATVALLLACYGPLAFAVKADSASFTGTPRHEAGRCALRGSCDRSFVGKEIPCVDNSKAAEIQNTTKLHLAQVCGSDLADRWDKSCCGTEQITALSDNFQQVFPLISSCPACLKNFVRFFCSFTCSPDQSLFLNVTSSTDTGKGTAAVEELDFFVDPTYAQGFYDSCKDVKLSAANTNVMELIGGGATTSAEFLRFLGKKQVLGSPFQINFPTLNESSESFIPDGMKPLQDRSISCASDDIADRCACIDCPQVCTELAPIALPGSVCHVGLLPCWSFVFMVIYLVAVAGISFGYFCTKRRPDLVGIFTGKSRRHALYERVALSRADADEDDEDEVQSIAHDGNSNAGSRHSQAHSTFTIGPGADLLDPADLSQPRTYRLNTILQTFFHRLGRACARYPFIVITAALVLVAICSSGWSRFEVETDPVKLWVAPNSDSAIQKRYFDENFGPFYRTEQIFISRPHGSVLDWDTIQWLAQVEKDIAEIKTSKGVSLDEVCFKPTGEACVIQSISGYWDGDLASAEEDDWREHLRECTANPSGCLPPFGQPIQPKLVLGGKEKGKSWLHSSALIVTYVVSNSLNETILSSTKSWERRLENYLKALDPPKNTTVSFSTELSLTEEISETSNTDAGIIILSYLIMFLYASVALGSFLTSIPFPIPSNQIGKYLKRLIIDSKVSLGLSGILIVLASVNSAVGICSYFGVRTTLVIAEVIPFLVLAVGVDNIFILSHELERQNTRSYDEGVEERVARTLGRMGPSILLSALSESTTFALGAIVDMPAVRNFAIYAAVAVGINAILQLTVFVSLLTLDQNRVESERVDCFPCVRVNAAVPSDQEGFLVYLIRRKYAPFLLQTKVKWAVSAFFGTTFFIGLILMQTIPLGLDQRVALPKTSYLINYFDDLNTYFEVGPPVYFVTKGLNASERAGQQKLCGRFSTCDPFSVGNILEGERRRPKYSYVTETPADWIDDFLHWLDPVLSRCCSNRRDDESKPCGEFDFEDDCKPCMEGREPAWNITMNGLPEGPEFMSYLVRWLSSPTSEDCPLGGSAAYGRAVKLNSEETTVVASHFMTYHTPLHTQEDFINAFSSARRIAADMSASTGAEIFPYSLFYVFFDQYLHIYGMARGVMTLAFSSIFLISSILLGSWRTGAIVSGSVLMIVVNVAGVMAVWNISLNALSLVNLVISVGIGLEFCSHIARGFMIGGGSVAADSTKAKQRDERVWNALVEVGSSVLSGITLTKIVGISVLAFTRSKIFEIYYFRMWLALVIIGALHGLVALPVFLSLAGGDGYSLADADEDWLGTVNRRYEADRFLADDASEESDQNR